MGHCEMLLAVAGLDQKALEERTRLLASRDWDTLPAYDRAAFFFAKKFSKTPWAIDDEDRGRLVAHFGRERALDVIWWASRCHVHGARAWPTDFSFRWNEERCLAKAPSLWGKRRSPAYTACWPVASDEATSALSRGIEFQEFVDATAKVKIPESEIVVSYDLTDPIGQGKESHHSRRNTP